MTTGQLILAVAVVSAVAIGLWRLRTDGRFATRAEPADESTPGAEVVRAAGAELGERATLLQFSSAFCAPCRVTRVVLGDVAEESAGVVHVDVDAEEHLAATRTLGILRTPTTVILDARGVEVGRASGAPSKAQVLAALGSVQP